MQSKAIDVPRELLNLNEEVEISLDGLYVNGKFFVTSISHEICHRTSIPTDGAKNKMLMKVVDDMFQVYYKCGLHVVKLHCDKKNRTCS